MDDDVYKFSLESDNEVEKGSYKLVVTLPNSEPKTYSSNWYFNYDDFKTKGNKTFVIVDNRGISCIYSDCPSPQYFIFDITVMSRVSIVMCL
jgi:hypothetical protein